MQQIRKTATTLNKTRIQATSLINLSNYFLVSATCVYICHQPPKGGREVSVYTLQTCGSTPTEKSETTVRECFYCNGTPL